MTVFLAPYLDKDHLRLEPLYVVFAVTFILPLLVCLYQSIILRQAAKRLFLEPLNDRGLLIRPFGPWKWQLLRLIDAMMTAHWTVLLVGPALDGLFWCILLGLERSSVDFSFKLELPLQITIIAHWYIALGVRASNDRLKRIIRCTYVFTVLLWFAKVTYHWYKLRWAIVASLRYMCLIFQVFLGDSLNRYILRGKYHLGFKRRNDVSPFLYI